MFTVLLSMHWLRQVLCKAEDDEEPIKTSDDTDVLPTLLEACHRKHSQSEHQMAVDGIDRIGTSHVYRQTDTNYHEAGTNIFTEEPITCQSPSLSSCHQENYSAQNDISLLKELKVTQQVVDEKNEVPVENKPLGAVRAHIHGYDEFPFLCDAGTINFIRRSHTIFILRGLPGSGKSKISECLQQTYPEAVVCSADHFFTDEEGNYSFDKSLLSVAHGQCQEKAKQSCEDDTRVIIIDNTNIQRWTMSHYMRLAQKQYFYHAVIVEPKTPWRNNVEELARRNSHRVDKETLRQKLESLRNQTYLPLYYGWFLSKQDSGMVSLKFTQLFQQCLDEMLSLTDTTWEDQFLPKDILSGLKSDKYVNPKPLLHCTASYMGGNRRNPYHEQDIVLKSMGKKFSLAISGYFASEKAICALVDLKSSDLSDSAILLKLFKKEEEEEVRERHYGGISDKIDQQRLHQYFDHGCSAHITITFAHGQQAKISGNEVLELLEKQYLGAIGPSVKTFSSSAGQLSCYGENTFHLSLHKPLIIDSLFHGFYSTSS